MTDTSPKPEPPAPRWRGRGLTVRTRLVLVAVVTITSLLGLVAAMTLDDWQQQIKLRNQSETARYAGQASLPLLVGAQTERALTAAYLAKPTPRTKAALQQQRKKTDKGVASFRDLSGTELAREHRAKFEYVERVYKELERLDEVRRAVDNGVSKPNKSKKIDKLTGYYSDVITKLIEFYQELSASDHKEISVKGRPLVGMFWASEALARENMLIARAMAAGRMSAEQRKEFASAYGAQHVMYERWVVPYLPKDDKALYTKLTSSDAWATKERVEQAIINAPTNNPNGAITELPSELKQWRQAYGKVAKGLGKLNLSRTKGVLKFGFQVTEDMRNRLLWQLAFSVGAILVIALLIVWIMRTVIRRTNRLRARTSSVAEQELPAIVGDLLEGRDADLSLLPQAKDRPRDEFEQVGNDIARLAQEAANAALTVFRERRGFARFAEGVSARAVVIVGRRMLAQLDELEQRYGDDEQLLEQLYELDHQAVRVRRMIENLLVLSGGGFDQSHDRPVHVANVLLDAAGESTGFKRVVKDFRAEAWIAPHTAGELTHLLAELIDNAAIFSPNEFEITVRSITAASGVAIEVEDRGFLRREQVLELNDRLDAAPTYSDLAESAHQLGLFVVGQLAKRLGVTVTLRESPYRGVQAIVFVPNELLAESPQAAGEAPAAPSLVGAPSPYQPQQQVPAPAAAPSWSEAQPQSQPQFQPQSQPQFHESDRQTVWLTPGVPAPDPEPSPAPQPAVTPSSTASPIPDQPAQWPAADPSTHWNGPDARGPARDGHRHPTMSGVTPAGSASPPSWSRSEGQFIETSVAGPETTGTPPPTGAPAPPTVPGLPQRVPGTHLASPLREDVTDPTQTQHAMDSRSLDEIEDAFSALDDITHNPDGGYR